MLNCKLGRVAANLAPYARICTFSLIGALAALMINVETSGAPVAKLTGNHALSFISANQWWPGTAWDNIYSEWHEQSVAKVNVIQPNGGIELILAVAADQLISNQQYDVWIDTDGVLQNDTSSHGPFLTDTWVGSFSSDKFGSADWQIALQAGSLPIGIHVWSVYLVLPGFVRIGEDWTVLISENISFNVE
jgi:hypothetical protein